MPTLETKRLILRRFRMEDVEALHREIYSDPNVVQYYNGDRVFTLDEVRENLLKRRNTGQMGYWTVTLKETGEVIGQVHLDPYANLGWHPLPEEIHRSVRLRKCIWDLPSAGVFGTRAMRRKPASVSFAMPFKTCVCCACWAGPVFTTHARFVCMRV